jgi:hypothetical protein
VRRQSGAATGLCLDATRKKIGRPLLKSQSGVVASLCHWRLLTSAGTN